MADGLLQRILSGTTGIFAGPSTGGIDPAQEAQARRQAILRAGLMTIAGSQPGAPGGGTLGSALVQGALAGQEAGGAARAGFAETNRRARLQALVSEGSVDPAMMRQLFAQAVAAGDTESMKAISEVLKVMQDANAQPNLQSEVAYNPETGRWEFASFNPRTGDMQFTGFEGPEPSSGVTINTGDTAQDTVVGRRLGEEFSQAMDAAAKARQDLTRLNTLEGLLGNDAVYQGTGGEAILRLKQIGSAITGRTFEGVPETQAALALIREMALEMRNPAGGAGMPGAMSDKDREFLMQIVPSLTNTREGNLKLIEARRRLAQRSVDVAQFLNEYMVRNGGQLDFAVYEAIQRRFGNTDLFGDLVPEPRGVGANEEFNPYMRPPGR